MTLHRCPDCTREVSSSAIACPHCGRPFATTVGTQRPAAATAQKWVGMVIVLAILLVLYAIATPRS